MIKKSNKYILLICRDYYSIASKVEPGKVYTIFILQRHKARNTVSKLPIKATMLALFLGVEMGLFYLGRGLLGVIFLFIRICLVAFLFFMTQYDVLHISLIPIIILIILSINLAVFHVLGAIISYVIASKYPPISKKWFAQWYSLLMFIAVPLVISLLTQLYIASYTTKSINMLPEIMSSHYILINKKSYSISEPIRGDIIIFKIGIEDYIMRIIGMPGEKLKLIKGVTYINGKAIKRKQIADFISNHEYKQYIEEFPDGISFKIIDLFPNSPYDTTKEYIVPKDSYFVMGDNRDNSFDSRANDFGFIHKSKITGKYIYRLCCIIN